MKNAADIDFVVNQRLWNDVLPCILEAFAQATLPACSVKCMVVFGLRVEGVYGSESIGSPVVFFLPHMYMVP